MNVGVVEDLSPGKCYQGGDSFVFANVGPFCTFTVHYDEYSPVVGEEDKCKPYNRLTEMPSPYGRSKPTRKRKPPENYGTENAAAEAPEKLFGLQEILEDGYRRSKGRGWRAEQLWLERLSNRNEQSACRGRSRAERIRGEHANTHDKRGHGRFKTRRGQCTPVSKLYLVHEWAVGKNYQKRLWGIVVFVAVADENKSATPK